MDAIMQKDLYNLIGAESTASVTEIKKAYRKKALSCHPDKNPNNPKAAELFNELTKVLEILTDEKTRAAYDQVIAAKKQQKERVRKYDVKRRKFKEDLEAREEAYKRTLDPTYNTKSDEDRLKAEIERLEREGSKQVQEEVMSVLEEIRKLHHCMPNNSKSSKVGDFKIKIRWKSREEDSSNGGYNYNNLHKMFSKYGDIEVLVVSLKKGRAIVEFGNKDAAETALLSEIGLAENPLTLRGLWDTRKHSKGVASDKKFNSGRPIFPANRHTDSEPCASLNCSSAPDTFTQQGRMSDAEFEISVLANLRRVQERKNQLIEETKAQERI
ncbi:PREDICTED: dnaJ homolog subfamily C member 17 [Dinoponera quadriceps]|uniref:DnaJ homolog subfamily C member 17 n=1 Tax=Dinoponera quadriceps TaxID=609295 RepID=A0A6P3XN56_DINQU|nr:PREDICTED: dnaJ homolog subfamily C member 17 [Dinoponera quadriceps]